MSLFDWAKYLTANGAVKMHTLLDYDGNLPVYVNIKDGKTADNKEEFDIPYLQKWLDKPYEEPQEPIQNYIQGGVF